MDGKQEMRACRSCRGSGEIPNPEHAAWNEKHGRQWNALTSVGACNEFARIHPIPDEELICGTCSGTGEVEAERMEPMLVKSSEMKTAPGAVYQEVVGGPALGSIEGALASHEIMERTNPQFAGSVIVLPTERPDQVAWGIACVTDKRDLRNSLVVGFGLIMALRGHLMGMIDERNGDGTPLQVSILLAALEPAADGFREMVRKNLGEMVRKNLGAPTEGPN